MTMTLVEPVSRDGGYTACVTTNLGPGGAPLSYTMQFQPPGLVRYNFSKDITMLLYGIPSGPGASRIVMTFVGPANSSATRPPTPQLPPALNWCAGEGGGQRARV